MKIRTCLIAFLLLLVRHLLLEAMHLFLVAWPLLLGTTEAEDVILDSGEQEVAYCVNPGRSSVAEGCPRNKLKRVTR